MPSGSSNESLGTVLLRLRQLCSSGRSLILPSIPSSASPALREACTAFLVRHVDSPDPELLFIRRASRPGDPWSGHVATPGGHVDYPETHVEAVCREVREEVGLEVHVESAVLRLPPLRVSETLVLHSFLFPVEGHVDPTCAPSEVAEAFWVPLSRLGASRVQLLPIVRLAAPDLRLSVAGAVHVGEEWRWKEAPAVLLREGAREDWLWGITLRQTAVLLALLGDSGLKIAVQRHTPLQNNRL